ncbi:hypothetical protein AGMMS49949_06460 [Alphaproteobacteria bacterium]|nr:hypothetical protein AGMMS49949_06460 [Alphaproteobacteria bacterium]
MGLDFSEDYLCVCGGAAKDAQVEFFRERLYVAAEEMAKKKRKVVCCGAATGVIGLFQDFLKEFDVPVVGAFAEDELANKHSGVKDFKTFLSYSERQSYLLQNFSHFLFLPGGLGTFHEFFSLLALPFAGLDATQAKEIKITCLDMMGWRFIKNGLENSVFCGLIPPKSLGNITFWDPLAPPSSKKNTEEF